MAVYTTVCTQEKTVIFITTNLSKNIISGTQTSTISLKKGRMLWHSLESQTSITSNTFRLQTSLIITACCFVISFHWL